MAFVARVLGERRICKLQATLVVGAPLQYTIYCAEHETISDSLGALVGVVSWSNLIGHFEFHMAAACLCISIGHLCVFCIFSYLVPLLIAGQCFVPMTTPQWAWLTLLSRGRSLLTTCFLCRRRWVQCLAHCTSGAKPGRREARVEDAAINYFVRYYNSAYCERSLFYCH